MNLVPVVVLTGLWLVLFGSTTPAAVLTGLALATTITLLGARRRRGPDHGVRPLALLRFVGHVGWQLIVSNLALAREVLTPTDYTRPGIVRVPLPPCSDLVLTVVANCISLTPGTLVLDAETDPPVLFVHVLHLDDIEAARAEIGRLHELAAAALPTSSTDRDPSTSDGTRGAEA